MRIWKIKCIGNKCFPYPKTVLTSPFSYRPLVIHDFNVYRAREGFWHVDIHMKDPITDACFIFGVPIDDPEFRKLVNSPLRGRILINEIPELLEDEEDRKIIEERIRRWGYW